MQDITYDCPYCLTHYVVWDSSMPPITAERNNELWEIVRAQYDKGYCKKCHSEDETPTVFEMDGMYTKQDVQDRFYLMMPCIDCGKYTKQDRRKETKPCQYCGGSMGIASQYHYSIRTWNRAKVVTPADRKKMGVRK